ncbi:general stress protein 26 [bacterium BMS3Abin07]|nr:general stress protein 26 [bacterium BMS3Abin07]GBE32738.1 general stress protein 26 [bacterium BMS3Bbin05]HDL21040.1 pyridoxamine 5'-phosphate oxidase family protein [Nitrospirota bacterium]HDO23465.1 pyridoxamine 5'-phosphate oxidase family protein [Nitrospirota bacterium]HDZ88025.1 pyridoxamine 5'-phosphate oxidase family protein [Nitrospirota bacterium]
MNKNEILGFLNTNPVFHLATVEGDKPHVRGMLLYKADEDGIIFHTGKMKDLHRQLTENPHVEMCFNNSNFENLIQVRVSGTVELIEDLELKKEIVQKREFLQRWVEQVGYEPLAVYRMRKCVATVWSMETNFAPKEFVEL